MAKKEIVISADKSNGTTRIALLENGELAELHVETPHHERTLGDIALGKVKKVMPSIRAAFVDIGQKQDAFLHYSDLSDNLPQQLAFVEQDNPEIASIRIRRRTRLGRLKRHAVNARRFRRKGKGTVEDALDHLFRTRRRAIKPRPSASGRKKAQLPDFNATDRPEECLKRDQRILVKIVKEPISSKGSRVSTDISLAGRFLVLVPLADYVAVSKKISSYKERRRLRALARSLVPDGFGVIVRTQADGKNARALDTDLRLLVEKWRKIETKLAGKPRSPITLHEDVNMVSSMVRDLFSDDYDRILIDDQNVYRNVKGYVQAVAPSMADAVQLYDGKRPVFDAVGIQKSVREAFESRVNLPSGGYLFFERTEAMHVVDVNSGRSGRGLSQEENSLRVNVEAARVIARQMRLRDLGGIMCVDFIDLRDDKNRRKVHEEFKKEFRKDRAVTKLLPMSDFGIVQITRQRLRPALTTLHTAEEVTGDGGHAEAPDEPPGPAADAEVPVTPPPPAAPPLRAPRERRRAEPPEVLVERMGAWVADYKQQGGKSSLTLHVHPFLCAFLNRRVPNWPTRWSFRHLVRIRVEEDAAMSPHEFAFVPADGAAAPADTPAAKPDAAPSRASTRNEPSARPTDRARRPAPDAPSGERRAATPTPRHTAPATLEARKPDGERSQESNEPNRDASNRDGSNRDASNRDGSNGDESNGDDSNRSDRSRGRRGGRGGRGGRGARGGSDSRRQESGEGGERTSRSRRPQGANAATGSANPDTQAAGEAAVGDTDAPKRRRRRGGRNRRRGGGARTSSGENAAGGGGSSTSPAGDA